MDYQALKVSILCSEHTALNLSCMTLSTYGIYCFVYRYIYSLYAFYVYCFGDVGRTESHLRRS